jgi:hypothetical protein
LIITPTFTANFDVNFGAEADAAKAAWAAAAEVFTNHFSDNIHINITVDALPGTKDLGRSFPRTLSISYAGLFASVSEAARTASDQIAIGPGGSMTAADPTNGAGTWFLTRAQAKALGFIPDDMSDDGGTTFGAGQPYTFSGEIIPGTFDFQGVAAHEISEVMGRIGGGGNSFSLIDNFSYTGPGTKGLRGGPGNNFSIDNGITLLKLFNDPASGGDTRDWAGNTIDAFNAFASLGVVHPVSAIDLQVMDVIGYGGDGPVGSLAETVGHITFLRAHELGSGYGKPPNFLDCEVIVLLAEEPLRSFGFKLRADAERPARWEMFELLRSAFTADSPVRLDYVKTGPGAGEIIRVANG